MNMFAFAFPKNHQNTSSNHGSSYFFRHKTPAARKIRPVPIYIFIIEFSSDIRIDAIPPVNESENLFPKRHRPDQLTVEQLFIRFAEFYDGRFACGDHDFFPRKRVYAVPFVLVS